MLTAACLAAPALGATTSPPGLLAVRIEPRALPEERARVVVHVEGCGPEPLDLGASVGRIERVRPLAPGHAIAEYVPPPEARPEVAIVSAACGGRHGWTVIPLVGRGVAMAHTVPGASVRVTIGTRSFGPVRADAEGVAEVPVEVPPGVRFAYQGERELALHIPPARHVHVVLDRAEVRADREEVVLVRTYAVTEAGAPREGAPLRLQASDGAVSAPAETEPGASLARWTLPSGRTGTVRLQASLEDDPGPAAAAEVRRIAGPPARIAVVVGEPRAVGAAATVPLDVRVLDGSGNLARAALGVEPAEAVAGVRERADGSWMVEVAVPGPTDGEEAGPVELRSGDLRAIVRIPVTAAGTAFASPTRPRRGFASRATVALRAGYLASTGGLGSPYVGMEATFWPRAWDRFGIAAEVGTFAIERSDDASLAGSQLRIDGRVRYVPAALGVRWRASPSAHTAILAGIGVAFSAVGAEVSVSGQGRVRETGVAPGVDAALGAGRRFGSGLAFLEARALWIGDPGVGAIKGDVLAAGLVAGWAHGLF